jgi:cysteine sulfinate desulfinase/cysteine desulfurase-like protein
VLIWRGQGYQVTELTVDKKGLVDIDELEKILSPDTAVVSLI